MPPPSKSMGKPVKSEGQEVNGGQEAGQGPVQGDSQCVIMFKYCNRNLKLRTLVRKPMAKAMAEFAKHRRVEVNKLRFHIKGTEEEVEAESNAGQYAGKTVMVTDA